MVLGVISPKTRSSDLMTIVAAAMPSSPQNLSVMMVAIDDARMLTKLLPIRMTLINWSFRFSSSWTPALLLALFFLIAFSAFFSSAETAMLSLNRFRLKHLKRNGHRGAAVAHELLKRKDQLISVILICNNFVNILASSIATIITLKFWGEDGIAAATIVMTIVILVFGEITPKTIAAYYPESVAFPAAYVLRVLRTVLCPFVWAMNLITGSLLRLIGLDLQADHKSHV